VPAGLVDPAAERQFCCKACRSVFEIIACSGLDTYYDLRGGPDAEPARATGRAYAELDDPAFLDAYARSPGGPIRTVELYLEGIHCSACVWLVEKLPRLVPGVIEARLDFGRALVRLTWNSDAARLSEAARALDSLGYPPHPARDAQSRRQRTAEDRRALAQIALSGAGAGNVMMLAFALYGGHFAGMEARYESLFRWTSMVIGLAVLAFPGRVFFTSAWAAIRTRTPHLDLPIALGLLVGTATATINTLAGRGEIYFDSLTMLVFLLLCGRWVQRRHERRTTDAIELLYSLTPAVARRLEGEQLREVPTEALTKGDVVEVRPGESFPADGEVTSGETTVDLALLTGESRPVALSLGDQAAAGSVNMSRPVRVRVDAMGQDTRAGRLMRLVEAYARRRAPLVLMAQGLAGHFTFGAVGLSIATFLGWISSGLVVAVDHATAVLIVTCPCALALATPLAVAVAIGRAARQRILVKGGDALERLARPSHVFLDKTGTLTEGRTAIVAWHGDTSLRGAVAAIEAQTSHPLAVAFLEGAHVEDLTRATDVRQVPGAGIEGRVDGRAIAIGSAAFARTQAARVPDWATAAHDRAAAAGHTPVWVVANGAVAALVEIGDPLRADVRSSLDALRARGWRVSILSGDDPATVQAVGSSLGLPAEACRGGMTPEAKAHVVEAAARSARVVMVGDGANDAAALSAAGVGIAVHGGAEASLAAADVYLGRPGLGAIADLLFVARRTVGRIRAALIVSLAYNLLAAGMATGGLLRPWMAALLMPISSFSVLALALKSDGKSG